MTLKGQNRVEFDVQYVQKQFSSLKRQNGGLLGLFPQILGLPKLIFSLFFTVGGL